MKFQLLPMGARFEYEGKVLTKTGPLTAAGEGGQRLIPRSAILKPLDAVAEAPRKSIRTLDQATVLSAFDEFYQTALAVADDEGRARLSAAKGFFLERLGK